MSENKNILFRTDSSSIIGMGHIMRDLVLASQYSDANIIFATQSLEGNINYKIKEAGYKLEILQSNDIGELDGLIKKIDVDLLVIDHYEITYDFEKQLKRKNQKLKILSFDDTYTKHYCDIVLNHNISADKSRYKGLVPNFCELRCGSKYTLLRDEFFQEFPQKEESKFRNILLAMGGVDSKELNIPILNVLESFNNIKINIITTTANKNLDKLKKHTQNKKNIQLHINTNKVAKLMNQSDLAVLTPSVTVHEAYFMKLPFIAIKTEDNQKDIYKYLQTNNFLTLNEFDREMLLKTITLQLNILDSKLINFTQLKLSEKEMILHWRNNESIRKWMYQRDEILLKNHLAYIDFLSSTTDREYFLLKKKENNIGVVSLTDIKDKTRAELGIYLNPMLKGYGSILMYKIIDYALKNKKIKTLNANVYIENILAVKLYKKFNFKVISEFEDSNGTLYHMELKNEDR